MKADGHAAVECGDWPEHESRKGVDGARPRRDDGGMLIRLAR
jgi:hypothetical protein